MTCSPPSWSTMELSVPVSIRSAPISWPASLRVSSVALPAWLASSLRSSARSSALATKSALPELMRARSMSFTKVSTLMCSWLLLRILPMTTVGTIPFFCWIMVWYQGRFRQSVIISSATRRESVSFHAPERSVTEFSSIRVTFLPPEQPMRAARLAQRQSVKILDMVFSCFQV